MLGQNIHWSRSWRKKKWNRTRNLRTHVTFFSYLFSILKREKCWICTQHRISTMIFTQNIHMIILLTFLVDR